MKNRPRARPRTKTEDDDESFSQVVAPQSGMRNSCQNPLYSIRVPNDSKKDMEIVVAAFLSFLLLFSFFERPVHSVEIWADDDSQSGRLV